MAAEIAEILPVSTTRVTLKQKALVRNVSDLLERYMQASRFIEPEQFLNICTMANNLETFSYAVASNINLPFITADATGPKHFDANLSRAKFEELSYDELKAIKSERGMGALGSSNK